MNQEQELTARPVVAITGAGGLVGSYLFKFLAEKGYRVKALIRTPNKPQHLYDFLKTFNASDAQNAGQVSIEIADVNKADSLAAALAGVDVVVHAAGNVNPFGERDEIFKTNVEGTRTVLKKATDAALKQFIHISSLSVITGQGDQYNVDETAPLHLCGENYADSKVEAEKVVAEKTRSSAQVGGGTPLTQTTVIRPGFIYGPYETTWMPRLIESIRTGKAALIDGGAKQTNVVYVKNLCLAIEHSILNEKAYGQVFNITDDEVVTKKVLFDAIADGLQMPRTTKKIPGFLAYGFCELVSSFAPNLSKETQMKLARYSRAAFRLAGVNQGFSIEKAKREIDYTNCTPFSQAMDETLPFFKNDKSGAPKLQLSGKN